MLAAPIIHARTKNYDFPSGLFVVPEGFSAADVSWARKYILDSTRFFELSGPQGRRVIFCNEELIVSGVSIRIGDLYRLCGREPKYEHVDGKRINYAFIGMAFSKSEVLEIPEISFEYLLEIYEQYMEMLWDKEPGETHLEAVNSVYTSCVFPHAGDGCDIPVMTKDNPQLVIDEKFAELPAIASTIIRQMKDLSDYAFCSDMPNATSVLDSSFYVVTSPNAQGIIETMKKKEEKARLEEMVKTAEKAEGEKIEKAEDVIEFGRRKKRGFIELLKKGEEELRKSQERKKNQDTVKNQELRRGPELKKWMNLGENLDWKKSRDLGKEAGQKRIQDWETDQEVKKNPMKNMKKATPVFGGFMIFLGTLWVLLSSKNDVHDSLSE